MITRSAGCLNEANVLTSVSGVYAIKIISANALKVRAFLNSCLPQSLLFLSVYRPKAAIEIICEGSAQLVASGRLVERIACVFKRTFRNSFLHGRDVNETFRHAKVAVHHPPRGQLPRNKSALVPPDDGLYHEKDNRVNRPGRLVSTPSPDRDVSFDIEKSDRIARLSFADKNRD